MAGERGYCGLGAEGRVFHHYLSYSEELDISPTYEILFTGCSHRCRFCSVLDYVTEPGRGAAASLDDVRAGVATAARRGAKTVSFVGGEPTVNLLAALRLVELLDGPLPVVWNSNMFMTPIVHETLDGVVSTFVGDVHWGNDACARRVGGVSPYFEVVTANIERAAGYANVIVRHLLLPGHGICCFAPIARWMNERLPWVKFRVLDNFWPNGHEASGPLAGRLPEEQGQRAFELAGRLGLNLVME